MKTGVFCRLLSCVLVLSGCVQFPDEPWVSKIKDLRSKDESAWSLKYDYKGRLFAYGRTPIEYSENEIHIGRVDWIYRSEQLLSADYFFSEGEVFRSEARCKWVTDSIDVEIWKEVDYQLSGDTIKIEATSFSIPDHHFLHQSYAQYVYNEDGNLGEVISRYVGSHHETSFCHSYYNYDRNVSYRSNLNMQSFFIEMDGPDVFFFFLLDMDRKFKEKKLPTRIRYCVDKGKAFYQADGLYLLDGDRLLHGEVVSDDTKVKTRMGFEYFEED